MLRASICENITLALAITNRGHHGPIKITSDFRLGSFYRVIMDIAVFYSMTYDAVWFVRQISKLKKHIFSFFRIEG
jgi:hypothetical protein